jgi:predicted site-specific integrase-resolvase
MYLTLGEAAKETGKSKATLSKYIKQGRLSVVEKTEAGFQIDPAEIFRVFPKNKQLTGKNEQTPVNTYLNTEIRLLREMLDSKDDVINDLRERLNMESEERRKLTLLLSDVRSKAENQPVEQRNGFFAWLIGSRA